MKKTSMVFLMSAAVVSFAQLSVDSVAVDSVWNSDSASRVSRDFRVSFIPQGSGWVNCSLFVSSDGGSSFWDNDSAFALNNAFGFGTQIPCGVKKTLLVRVLGGDRDNFVVRIKARQPDPGHWPAWRIDMTQADMLYYVSSASGAGLAGYAPALTGLPTHFGAGAGGGGPGTAGWDIMSGYSSGTLLESEGGPWGTVVYGTGGHTRLQNQMLGINLNADSPVYSWWQQPAYKTSATGGAEMYYNPSEEAALLAGPRGTAAIIPAVGEDPAGWDKAFPMAFDGWIYPAKLVTGQMGDNVPHGLRFFGIAYVPASVTGTAPMMFVHTGPQGPFSQSWLPTGSLVTDWVDSSALWDAGGTMKRRMPYYFKNLTTGAWTEHKWRPNYLPYTYGGFLTGCFRDIKKVLCLGMAGTGGSAAFGFWTIDMNGGFGSHSVGPWTIAAGSNGGTSFAMGEYSCGAFTDGHPTGRHLVYTPDANFADGLLMLDVDAGTVQRIPLAGTGFSLPSGSDYMGFSYDAALNRILVLLKNPSTHALTYYVIKIPADPAIAADYTVALRSVATSSGGMPMSDIAYMYGKTRLHPTLGCILVPTNSGRMMGFVPGP